MGGLERCRPRGMLEAVRRGGGAVRAAAGHHARPSMNHLICPGNRGEAARRTGTGEDAGRWRSVGLGPLALAAALAAAVPVDAQDLPTAIGGSRQFRWERVAPNQLWLSGEVEIDGAGSESWRFHADDANIYTDESLLVATGNVVFASGNARLAADRAEFDYEQGTGMFFSASGSTELVEDIEPSMFGTQEPEMRFWGALIEKLGPRTYRLTDGAFTSCIQPTPRWQLQVSSVTLDLGEYARMRHARLLLKGVPIFYLPFMHYPIQDEDRATGFLMPSFGTSNVQGSSISSAFFWAINRSHDATVFHDWLTDTGQGLGGEYRYVLGQGSRGDFETHLLNERETPDPFQGGDATLPARRSFRMRGNLQHTFTDAIQARGQVDYFSDIEVQQEYQRDIFQATNSSRTFGGNVTGSWNAYTLNGTADFRETFFGVDDASLHGAGPRVSFSQSERQLGTLPVYYGFNSEYANLLQRQSRAGDVTDSGLTRFDVNPLIRVPFTRWPFLTFNTSVGYRRTHWRESIDLATTEQVGAPISRSMFELATEITGPVFVKIWDTPDTDYSERMKHLIEPWISVERTTAVDNFDQIVRIDSTDSIVGNTTRLRYGIDNRLYARRGDSGAQEFLTIGVEQTYYTDERASQFDQQFLTSFQQTAPSNLSPLALTVRAAITEGMDGSLRAEYDTHFMALRTIRADADIAFSDRLFQRAGWSQRRFIEGLSGFDNKDFLDHTLNSFTNFRARDNKWGSVYQFNYDVQLGRMVQQRMRFYYNAQCCGIAIEYQTYNLANLGFRLRHQEPQDRSLYFAVTLAGLGTFSTPRGAFGPGTGMRQY